VIAGDQVLGVITVSALGAVSPEKWNTITVEEAADHGTTNISSGCDVMEALRLLLRESGQHMLLVTSAQGQLEGILTQADIPSALKLHYGYETAPSLKPT
jgi:predicted transcriptional regulator